MTDYIDVALVKYLEANPGLTALLSERIYPEPLPQPVGGVTLPAITYTRVSGVPRVAHDGDSNLLNPLYQLKVWSSTKAQSRTIMRLMRQALSGYSGLMGDLTIQASFVRADRDLTDPDTGLFTPVLEVELWHGE